MGTSPSQGFDGVEEYDTGIEVFGRDWRHRLCWGVTPKLDYEIADVARMISEDPRNPHVFVDTSLFDSVTPPGFWERLLNSVRVTIVPSVRRELDPWLGDHGENIAAQAILLGDSAFDVQKIEAANSDRFAFEYYVSLLAMRKKIIRFPSAKFEEEYGRPPSEAELKSLHSEYHRKLRPRGYNLAVKSLGSAPANLTTDERLVFAAVSSALRSRRPLYLLTKDEDVQEQFYKLIWMLDTQYRAMLIAKTYRDSPNTFQARPMSMAVSEFAEAFIGTDNLLLALHEKSYYEVLPRLFTPVDLCCLVVGQKITEMRFSAEREMSLLLDTKTRTLGLNTDALDGKNCHIAFPAPPGTGHAAAIVNEERHTLRGCIATVSMTDARIAVENCERYKRRTPRGMNAEPF